MRSALATIALALALGPGGAWAVSVAPDELQQNDQWVRQNLLGGAAPFSFVYNGQPSSTLLPTWSKTTEAKQLDAQRTQYTLKWTDPSTGLEVRCQAIKYADYPVVEWTTFLRNTGAADTPVLQEIKGLNATWTRAVGGEFKLQGLTGDGCAADSFKPYETTLAPNSTKDFSPDGGRPTNKATPYYNLSMPGGGVILAIGWPGQWSSRFIRNSGNALQVTAGQASTHFSLRPGEKVRTPLIAVLSWQGADTVRAQNLWRRWMLTHNLPGATGKPMPPLIFQCAGDFYDEMKSTAAGEITYAGKYADAGAKPDYWVIDAGWYSCGSSWFNVGTWDPDPARYPKGIKEVSDYVHSRGMKFTLWFEPERVTAGSGLANKHPEWVFGGTGGGLLNLGKSEVRNWLIGHVDSMIAKDGIDLYRQDFGLDPLTYWQNGDTAGRQGMSENLHVQGYLAYMDELRRRHPDMPIDICAAGGRRNELEDLRRAVPLLRSDYRPNATANQCQTYGLASWIPYFGTGVTMADDYAVRSSWCPALGIGVPQDVLKNGKTSWSTYKRMLAEQRQVAPYLLGDYYPLTPYSQEEHVWMAWQFDRPDLGAGMVQAFRRAGSDQECIKVRLSGLDPAGSYRVTNLDTKASKTMPGSELMGQGLLLQIGVRSGSLVITYCKSP